MLSVDELIKIALAEDIGPKDITTENLVERRMKRVMALSWPKSPWCWPEWMLPRKVFLQLEATVVRFKSEFADDGDTANGRRCCS